MTVTIIAVSVWVEAVRYPRYCVGRNIPARRPEQLRGYFDEFKGDSRAMQVTDAGDSNNDEGGELSTACISHPRVPG